MIVIKPQSSVEKAKPGRKKKDSVVAPTPVKAITSSDTASKIETLDRSCQTAALIEKPPVEVIAQPTRSYIDTHELP